MGNICFKLFLILDSGSGGEVIERKSLHTMNAGQRLITIALLQAICAQVSYKQSDTITDEPLF